MPGLVVLTGASASTLPERAATATRPALASSGSAASLDAVNACGGSAIGRPGVGGTPTLQLHCPGHPPATTGADASDAALPGSGGPGGRPEQAAWKGLGPTWTPTYDDTAAAPRGPASSDLALAASDWSIVKLNPVSPENVLPGWPRAKSL